MDRLPQDSHLNADQKASKWGDCSAFHVEMNDAGLRGDGETKIDDRND